MPGPTPTRDQPGRPQCQTALVFDASGPIRCPRGTVIPNAEQLVVKLDLFCRLIQERCLALRRATVCKPQVVCPFNYPSVDIPIHRTPPILQELSHAHEHVGSNQ